MVDLTKRLNLKKILLTTLILGTSSTISVYTVSNIKEESINNDKDRITTNLAAGLFGLCFGIFVSQGYQHSKEYD